MPDTDIETERQVRRLEEQFKRLSITDSEGDLETGFAINRTLSPIVTGAPPTNTGACCLSDGSCVVETSDQCAFDGGTYKGDSTVCDPNPCPVCGTLNQIDLTVTFSFSHFDVPAGPIRCLDGMGNPFTYNGSFTLHKTWMSTSSMSPGDGEFNLDSSCNITAGSDDCDGSGLHFVVPSFLISSSISDQDLGCSDPTPDSHCTNNWSRVQMNFGGAGFYGPGVLISFPYAFNSNCQCGFDSSCLDTSICSFPLITLPGSLPLLGTYHSHAACTSCPSNRQAIVGDITLILS